MTLSRRFKVVTSLAGGGLAAVAAYRSFNNFNADYPRYSTRINNSDGKGSKNKPEDVTDRIDPKDTQKKSLGTQMDQNIRAISGHIDSGIESVKETAESHIDAITHRVDSINEIKQKAQDIMDGDVSYSTLKTHKSSGLLSAVSVVALIKNALSSTGEVFGDGLDELPLITYLSLGKMVVDTRIALNKENPGLHRDEVAQYESSQKVTPEMFDAVSYYFPYAYGAYKSKAEIKELVTDNKENMFLHWSDGETAVGLPGFFSCYNHEKKEVIVAIKGTNSVEDLLTDLLCEPAQLDSIPVDGKVHMGIGHSGEFVVQTVLPYLNDLFVPLGYSVTFTGHSLGAGVAALACLMLAPETGGKFALPQGTKVKAVIFAPPPVVNNTFVKAIQAQGSPDITSVIHRHDIIPRGSLTNVKQMLVMLKELEKLPDDEKERVLKQYSLHDILDDLGVDIDVHDDFQMEVPGKVIYFYEDAAAENDAEDKGDLYNMVLCDALFPSFTRISIDPRLVFDHACASYESAFKRLTRAMKDRAEGESEKDLEVAPETEKKVKQLDE